MWTSQYRLSGQLNSEMDGSFCVSEEDDPPKDVLKESRVQEGEGIGYQNFSPEEQKNMLLIEL